uniref:Uncharacterized protein n=1 Tax=Proboscia inermis TaxID=420281 RepID=A0A6T8JT46_9STRA|mmetsp:Transcript_31058/g.31336  ORF Transcript_31058/g.31336 Transcript_31058/m.31336 type:complete len:124 (+) Transcript_31058:46-417(+)
MSLSEVVTKMSKVNHNLCNDDNTLNLDNGGGLVQACREIEGVATVWKNGLLGTTAGDNVNSSDGLASDDDSDDDDSLSSDVNDQNGDEIDNKAPIPGSHLLSAMINVESHTTSSKRAFTRDEK